MSDATPPDPVDERPVGAFLALFLIYVVWGSTYLAIRIAIRDGSGFTPFFLGASRTLASAFVLLGWAVLRGGKAIIPNRRDIVTVTASGLLLWIGGNGMVMFAEQRADSGMAALMVGTLPIWTVIIESVWDRRFPSFKLFAAIALGFLGLGVLTHPTIARGNDADLTALTALVAAPFCWGLGSVLQVRRKVVLPKAANAGYQQLAGGLAFLLLAVTFGEPVPSPVPEAIAAWAYLVLFGGVIAFTSYTYVLGRLPTSVVMTYAYVNPVIAVFLGWWVLHEPIALHTLMGTALILLGIAGVFHERFQVRRARTPDVSALHTRFKVCIDPRKRERNT